VSLEPTVGLVIRYDFLWKDEEAAGHEDGSKDRPCAIVLVSKEREDKSREVLVCAITHSPPREGETAVEIPHKVAMHLNLDHDRMWIKTHEINRFKWEESRIPFGVSQTPKGDWSYGLMPHALREQTLKQLQENSRKKSLSQVKRDQ
jgi:mRNA-degrading endonuclease toxin of MazEF toxin-antitoxin module